MPLYTNQRAGMKIAYISKKHIFFLSYYKAHIYIYSHLLLLLSLCGMKQLSDSWEIEMIFNVFDVYVEVLTQTNN